MRVASPMLQIPSWAIILIILTFSAIVNSLSVSNTILIFARDEGSAYTAYSGLEGYGIPYEVVIVPSGGTTLPTLGNNSTQTGNYGGIIVMGEVSYQYSDGFRSALTSEQWQTIFAYQEDFGVRMARIDVYPTPEFSMFTLSDYPLAYCLHEIPGTTPANSNPGCCTNGEEQLLSFTNTTAFDTAGLKR